MSKDNYPVVTGGTNDKGQTVTTESLDRGTYVEVITKVEKGDSVDYYVDKQPK